MVFKVENSEIHVSAKAIVSTVILAYIAKKCYDATITNKLKIYRTLCEEIKKAKKELKETKTKTQKDESK